MPLNRRIRNSNKYSSRSSSRSSWCGFSLLVLLVLVLVAHSSEELALRFHVLFGDPHHPSVVQQQQQQHRQAKADSKASQNAACQYFLAESSLSSGALGVYTARTIAKGATAQPGPDVCVGLDDEITLDVIPGSATTPSMVCLGLASLLHKSSSSEATNELVPPPTSDNAGLHRSKDIGAGAISSWYGVSSRARQAIPAGAELTLLWQPENREETISLDESSTVAEQPSSLVRSPEWLRQNGICLDNLKVDTATAPFMGRGAFATRPLQKGWTVAPMPLQLFRNGKKVLQESLLLNYCLQPRSSDVLACQLGPHVGLINHSSERPNVALRWSSLPALHHAEWLTLPKKQFWATQRAGGLVLELYATQDLRAGDELFLDYGEEWEIAWTLHAQSWKPPAATVDAAEYVYHQEMTTNAVLKTVQEQEKEPNPANLATTCQMPLHWQPQPGSVQQWTKPDLPWPKVKTYFCHILEHTKSAKKLLRGVDYVYRVALSDQPEFDVNTPIEELSIVTDVPRTAIAWTDKPFASDEHLPGAFRHPMMMPDHLVPKSWLKEFEQSDLLFGFEGGDTMQDEDEDFGNEAAARGNGADAVVMISEGEISEDFLVGGASAQEMVVETDEDDENEPEAPAVGHNSEAEDAFGEKVNDDDAVERLGESEAMAVRFRNAADMEDEDDEED